MFKALGLGGSNSSYSAGACLDASAQKNFNPPLDARADLYSWRDYLRPMAGAAIYGLFFSTLFTLPLLTVPHPVSFLIASGIAIIVVFEMAMVMSMSVFFHHCVFLHRLKEFGPQYYNTEIGVNSASAQAFELCLAATSDLPKSKIVSMDEKNGTIIVAMKGNFWITVDRIVTMRVREIAPNQSTISIDPSIKLSLARQRLLRLIWGDKWYPLIFRSDINWNRKIIDTVSTYIASVPNWDHSYDPHEIERERYAFKADVTTDAA